MKRIIAFSTLLITLSAQGQNQDTLTRSRISTVKYSGNTLNKIERISPRVDTRIVLYGDYNITGYDVLSLKTPSVEELNEMIGTIVKVQQNSITGTNIDPMSFDIYQIETQRRDDFIFRVFGREIKAPEPNIPESFNVHKTDNENCYGIIDLGNGLIAIPYKGVLLYLKRI